MTHNVRDPLPHDPAKQLLMGWINDVDGAGQFGGDPRGTQQLPTGGKLAGERHLAVAGDRSADVL
jgi:hypothetical protein